MGDASYVRSSFLGGEWSKLAQGRYHDEHYVTALNVCLNGIPIETGAWVRRPGFGLAGTTRGGNPGRCIKFDFQGNAPYTMEFTDAHLRFWAGLSLVDTNDSVVVSSISTANPAVATLATAVTWATADQGYFTLLSTSCPLLQNRVFALTKSDTTHFSLADAITGAAIDGSTLGVGSLASTATLNRVLDVATPYIAGGWANVRSVQTEKVAFLLDGDIAPYAVTVTASPTSTTFATFGFAAATFNDGPYLDPFTNGAQVTPNIKVGVIQLTVSFPTYSATISYPVGAFVTGTGVNSSNSYESLVDQNVGNTPPTPPATNAFWVLVQPGAAINNGNGFTQTDIGRSVRLFSEPQLWTATSFAVGAVVSYNPSNQPGQTTYWQCITAAASTNIPGTDLTHWSLLSQGGTSSPAIWTWGTIASLLNFIAGNVSGVTHVGDMTQRANAFDGTISSVTANSAFLPVTDTLTIGGAVKTTTCYAGQNYSAGSPISYAIASATIYPSTDNGFVSLTFTPTVAASFQIAATALLYASNTLPASAANGTLLGSVSLGSKTYTNTSGNGVTVTLSLGNKPLTITSNDQSTLYKFVWIELSVSYLASSVGLAGSVNVNGNLILSQAQFVNAATTTTSSGINLEILGPALLYTQTIRTWRLGVYSNTTGWPTCGTYSDGRIWLAGSVPNRVDASVSNGITGGSVNFAPTDQYGNVLASSAISYTFNAPDANPILWMIPDLQGIIAGTQAGEWLIVAPTSGGFTPTNIAARRVTRIGCANIEPQRTEHTIVFVQKFLRNVMEYFADVFSGKFTAPKLTVDAKHLTVGNVQELAYQQELCPTLWARVNNALIGCTYRRNTLSTAQGPDMMGWHRTTLGSGRTVESIVTGSSTNGNLDALTVVTNDTTSNIRFVEILTDILDEGSLNSAASYLDAAITPSSTVSSSTGGAGYGTLVLNGLWSLNGKTVTAWLGGLDCGDYAVSSGSIIVPYGDGVGAGTANGMFTSTFVTTGITANGNTMFTGTMPARVGFTYTSDGQLTRPIAPAESGTRAGPGFGKLGRDHYLMFQFEGATTNSISFGTKFDSTLLPALFRQLNGIDDYTIDLQFSGIYRDQPNSEYDFDRMPCWRVTRPYICNIAAFGPAGAGQDV